MAVTATQHGRKTKKSGKLSRVRAAGAGGRHSPQAVPAQVVTKTADDKGRVVLGGRFANRVVIIKRLSDTEVVVKLARVIPESEAWLYENAEALAAVRKGLAQARAGELTQGPDVEADATFGTELED